MPSPEAPSKNRAFALIALILALVAVVIIVRLGLLSGLRGALSTITFGTDNFLYGPLASAGNANVPAGTHGIFTCPASIGASEVWLGPSSFSGISGLKIYEYSSDFAAEKNPVNSTWPGERYGFQGNTSPALSVFKAGRTYYVHADQQFDFRCSGAATAGSSSSISSSAGNQPPVFNGLNSAYILTVGQPFSLTVSATDPEDDFIRFIMASQNMQANSIHLDVNGDTFVDGADYNLIESVSGKHTGDPGFLAAADLNANGVIDASDLLGFLGATNSLNLGGSSFDQTTGQLSWTPTTAGTYVVSFTALNDQFPYPTPYVSKVVTFTVQPSAEAGLLGYWPLDEGNGTVSQDATTGDHDVVFSGGATWGQPLTGVGSSANLSGDNQFVNIGALSVFNFQYDRDFSLAAWVKPSGASADEGIILGKVEFRTFSFPGWAMTYTADHHFGFKMSGSSFQTPVGLEVKTNAVFDPGTAHHVVVSYNGRDDVTGTLSAEGGTSNAVKIYVDGSEYSVAQGNLTVTLDNLRSPAGVSSILNNGEVQIGMGDSAISPFAGLIDDVKIYNQVIVPTN